MLASSKTLIKSGFVSSESLKGQKVYFIGIGGSGMSALARIFVSKGCTVAGSDIRSSSTVSTLEKMGIAVNTRQDGSLIPLKTDMVIVSAAIAEDNPELRIARRMGVEVLNYSQMLGVLMKGKRGIAISGTHGKTTTSAMISTVLKKAGLDPTCVIGGEVPDIGGNAHLGKGDLFITEACEYNCSFLDLFPNVGVITNIEEDHLDYYESLEDIINAFGSFAFMISKDGLLVANNSDKNVAVALKRANCRVETYSLSSSSDWYGKVFPSVRGINKFRIYRKGCFFDDFILKVPGIHNVLNALASIVVCTFMGVEKEVMKTSLASFNGAKRRFQIVGVRNNITVIDDYAHHPTEILVTMQAARELYPDNKIWCVFQPHQYSRTRYLLEKFSKSFCYADKVILADVYAERDNDLEKTLINSLKLKEEIRKMGVDVQYIAKLDDIKNVLYENAQPGDVVMTMGAGNIWKVAHGLVTMYG